MEGKSKSGRILNLYTQLMQGNVIYKQKSALAFGVTEKSIQRDIDELRTFFVETSDKQLCYDPKRKGYKIEQRDTLMLSNSEVLAVAKILLESRSMLKSEMFPILDKLVANCTPQENLKQVKELLANEKFHYVEPHHGCRYVGKLWDIGTAIYQKQYMEIAYHRTKDDKIVTRRVQPVGVLFSEYYFYLAAFIEGIDKEKSFDNPQDKSPTIYRIDRIESYTIQKKRFYLPYKDRFEEGEMRKRIQFMYGGDLQRIEFEYHGLSVEAILDRLPTARIIREEAGVYTITAEVFGKGIDMWLKSQGDYIKLKNKF